jgi:enoyl-CoA hydratase/carnithine racemase
MEALRIRFVNKVAKPENLMAEAKSIAQELAKQPPSHRGQSKEFPI